MPSVSVALTFDGTLPWILRRNTTPLRLSKVRYELMRSISEITLQPEPPHGQMIGEILARRYWLASFSPTS